MGDVLNVAGVSGQFVSASVSPSAQETAGPKESREREKEEIAIRKAIESGEITERKGIGGD